MDKAVGHKVDEFFLPRNRLQDLLDVLQRQGYSCVGPQVREGAIVYAELHHARQLPHGIQDEQKPGYYRLHPSESWRNFSWANGPQAIKPWVFQPHTVLWQAQKADDGSLAFEEHIEDVQPVALIGARACDLAALKLTDQHFLGGAVQDPAYHASRTSLFLVAVNCSHSADTCFCVSTGDGPAAKDVFDLRMDELEQGFVICSGSDRGARVLSELSLEPVSASQKQAVAVQRQDAIDQQQRTLPGRDLRAALNANLQHPAWEEIAERCLACGNCTSVCPTCFCYREGETPSLSSQYFEHYREWDSCFSDGHSYIHGLTVRKEIRQRYRQWLVHKLGNWHDQFGRSGCVGCGRCITWCPVGIDITVEADRICGESCK